MAPELELDVRAPPPPKPAKLRAPKQDDAPLELAVDPRDLVAQRAAEPRGESGREPPGYGAGAPLLPRGPAIAASAPVVVADIDLDARVLAGFGQPPRSWILTPFYAWRVLRRQRELKAALVGRRSEAEHAGGELEDALVAFTERVRPAAEKQQTYAAAFEDLVRAEDVLRSRDRVLAAEQDAQKERLSQVDGRMSKLEGELAQAHVDEHTAATELTAAQGALAREEAKLKRAETELKAALQRSGSGAGG
jgi:hypothetical protein